jgi:DNA repair exonuclease SbcCD ATPase subunit
MIHLVLRNFRCYSSLEKNFESGRTLLTGLSGSGKTTILCGIYWILFDKLDHIKGVDGKKPFGQLSIYNGTTINIERSKQPNNLIVRIEGNVYENTIGQLKIYEIFGSELAWMTTSYISQGNRNALLEATGQKRFNIIRSLLFLDTNDANATVSSDIIKIGNKLTEISGLYDSMKIIYDTEVKAFDREWNNANIDTSYVHENIVDENGNVNDSTIENVKDQIMKCERVKDELESLIRSYSEEQLKRQWNVNRIQLLEKEIENIDISSFEIIKYKRDVECLKRLRNLQISQDLFYKVKPKVVYIKKSIERLCYINSRLDEIGNLSQLYNYVDGYLDINYNIVQQDIYTIKHLSSLNVKLKQLKCVLNDVSLYDIETAIKQETLKADIAKMRNPSVDRTIIDLVATKEKLDDLERSQRIRELEMSKVPNGQYNKSFIENKILQGSRLISVQEDLKVHHRRTELMEYLRKHPLEENLDKKIGDIRQAILSSKAMTCPHCHGNVILGSEGGLEKISIIECIQPVEELKKRLSSLESQKSYCEVVKIYRTELSKLKDVDERSLKDMRILKPNELNDIQTALQRYKTVEIIDDKSVEINHLKELLYQHEYYHLIDKVIEGYPSSKDMVNSIEYKRLIDEIEETKRKINEEIVDIDHSEIVQIYDYQQKRSQVLKLNDEKETIMNKYDFIRGISSSVIKAIEEIDQYPINIDHLVDVNFDELERQKATYETKNQQISLEKTSLKQTVDRTVEIKVLNEELNVTVNDIETLNKVKEHTTKYVYFVRRQNDIDVCEIQLNNTKQQVDKIAKLKTIAFKLENQLLSNAISTLNAMVLENLSRMFDEPISVRLEMEKNGKPNINLIVLYKGMEVSPSQLSGGEQDRLSLALTLAFSSLSKSPILLLDECLSSLDTKNKENALKCLRSDDKIVITVDHEAVEGYYDYIVRV